MNYREDRLLKITHYPSTGCNTEIRRDRTMQIGIIGAGNMARGLGNALLKAEHQVMISSREIEKAKTATQDLEGALAGTFQDATDFGEVVILAVPWEAGLDTIKQIAPSGNKVLVDISNAVPHDTLELAYGHTTSFAEMIQAAAPQSRVVKAFNTVLAPIFHDERPEINGQKVNVFIAGDDEAATRTVAQLAEEMGFAPVLLGILKEARLIEPIGAVVIRLVVANGFAPHFAINILTNASGS